MMVIPLLNFVKRSLQSTPASVLPPYSNLALLIGRAVVGTVRVARDAIYVINIVVGERYG